MTFLIEKIGYHEFFDTLPTYSLKFYVNNECKNLSNIDPKKTVLEYLRENGYTGTKYGCGEGGCGACTVVIADYDTQKCMIRYRSANACLTPLCAIHEKQIITIEGIGNCEMPHCIQERLAKGHGSQCGFCTPGIVMAFYAFLKLNPEPSVADIEDALDGNLCRCTGYRPIVESFRTFSKDCNSSDTKQDSFNRLADFSELKAYDPNTDLPFPSDLVLSTKSAPLVIGCDEQLWFQPVTIQELLKLKQRYPNGVIVGGNTEIGIFTKIKMMDYRVFINIAKITDFQNISIKSSVLEIGANITLNELTNGLKEMKKETQTHQASLLNALLTNLRWFASTQIRNFATLAGNVVNASPISDLNTILIASDAILHVATENGERKIPMREFILGYRKIALQANEILLKICIKLPESRLEIIRAYKQAKRRDDDIATVTAAFRVKLDEEYRILDLDLSYGGVAATTLLLKSVNEKSKGLQWGHDEHLAVIQDAILDEINLPYSVIGGMPTYRRTLTASFFTKFYHQVMNELNITQNNNVNVDVEEIERGVSSSIIDFGTARKDPYIGTTQPNVMALKQTTGVAKYVDDMPKQANELHAAPVLSSKAHALIKKVDASKALELNDVYAFVDHKDVKSNTHGFMMKDDEFFASSKVNFVGQIIGLVIAESKSLARKAATLVHVEYEELDHVLTIEDAIEKNSFFDFRKTIQKGTFDSETFKVDDREEFVFEGSCRIGGQEHFYLETQSCLVIPKNEDNEIEIYSSTQNPSEVQREVADALGIPHNRVVCKVKRLGGAFGGKETRPTPLAVVAAAAAYKLKRPIRFVLDRDVDMITTGTRHPFYGRYKLRVTKDGLFKAYDLELINNAGYSYDLSHAVMCNALYAADNVYNFQNMRVSGRLARTNIASNTAFRGFGAPQSMLMTEMMITEVAEQLKLDPLEIRQKNMYKEHDMTHYSREIQDWYVPEMWTTIIEWSKYKQLRSEIEEFNANNLYKKRGLAITPVKFLCVFKIKFLNQAAALVHIYTDGSVLLAHGGTEMGQGLHTKMIQIAANTLQVPPECIYINDTSTDKVPNSIQTAASVSSDLNGMAVYNACKELYERLEPYRVADPGGNLKSWATAAFFDRVSLSATGFYKLPNFTYDEETNTGHLGDYSTDGVAVSAVELDVLTGDHVILRSDIIMDIGNSINFAIDIGQIEGAFLQGVGWCTLEELLVSPTTGSLLTTGPGYYKIPSFHTAPIEFNVKILKDKNYKHQTIKSSKGVGEPPLFLGASVFFALRDAVNYARKSNGVTEPLLGFSSPCTAEVLRLACADSIVSKSMVVAKKNEKLWAVRP